MHLGNGLCDRKTCILALEYLNKYVLKYGGFGSHRKGIEKILKWIMAGYFFNTLDQVYDQSSFMSVGIGDGKINVL